MSEQPFYQPRYEYFAQNLTNLVNISAGIIRAQQVPEYLPNSYQLVCDSSVSVRRICEYR